MITFLNKPHSLYFNIRRTVITETVTNTTTQEPIIPPVNIKQNVPLEKENSNTNELNLDQRIEATGRKNRELQDELNRLRTESNYNTNIGTEKINNELPKEGINSSQSDNTAESSSIKTVHVSEEILGNIENSNENILLMQKIRTASNITGEVVAQNLRQHNINIQHTQEANLRAQSIYERGLSFLQSIPNPGRIAFYTVGTIALGYTIWNVIRYRELPFTSFLGSVLSSGTSASPTTSNIININYPEIPLPRPTETMLSSDNSLLQTIFNSPYFYMTVVGLAYILKKVK